MVVLNDWDLDIDADKVLWGQGADPAVIRARRPALAKVAERAVEEGRHMLSPRVAYRRIPVKATGHERLLLEGGGSLHGPLITQHAAGASEVIVAVCTVGSALSERAAAQFDADPVAALALDGVASAAAEALAEAACQRFEQMAAGDGLRASIPLNPGMVGWPVEEGQKQIFSLLDAREIGVELTPSGLMNPLKSVSLVMGLGAELVSEGRSCDYCAMRETCRYKSHYN